MQNQPPMLMLPTTATTQESTAIAGFGLGNWAQWRFNVNNICIINSGVVDLRSKDMLVYQLPIGEQDEERGRKILSPRIYSPHNIGIPNIAIHSFSFL